LRCSSPSSVGEFDRPVAAGQRLEERGKIGSHAAEVHLRRELEPVDAAGHVPGHAPRRTVPPAGHLDGPAGGRELGHRTVEPAAGDLHVVRRGGLVEGRAPRRRDAVPRQDGERLTLGGPVATDEDPPGRIGRAAGGIVGGDLDAGVVEPDPAGKLHPGLAPAARRPGGGPRLLVADDRGRIVEHQFGHGRARFDPPACPRGKHDGGNVGQPGEPFDEAVHLAARQRDRPAPLELVDPAGDGRPGSAGVGKGEPGDAVGEYDEPAAQDGPRRVEPLALAATDEHATERGLGGPRQDVVLAGAGQATGRPNVLVVGLEDEGELPRPGAVPGERHDVLRLPARLRLKHEPARLAEQRDVRGRGMGADDDP